MAVAVTSVEMRRPSARPRADDGASVAAPVAAGFPEAAGSGDAQPDADNAPPEAGGDCAMARPYGHVVAIQKKQMLAARVRSPIRADRAYGIAPRLRAETARRPQGLRPLRA
jgi:hypothetical protein